MNWTSVWHETLNTREWAVLFWLIVVVVWALSIARVRSSLKDVVRSALNPHIVLPVLAMFAYVTIEVLIGYRLSLWSAGLMKGTIIWTIASGLLMFINFREATEKHFFTRTIRKAIGVTAFVEYLINLVTFNIFVTCPQELYHFLS